MIRNENNPLIKPDMVKPSLPGFRVRGAFNAAATIFNDEIILLLRISEDCPAREGYVAVPIATISKDTARPEIFEVSIDDPDVRLKDTRGIVYKGQELLSTMSHLRLARSSDGIHFKIEDKPFLFPAVPYEKFGIEDARITRIDDSYYINYTCVSGDGWATALATTKDFINIERKGIIFPPPNKDVSIFPEKISGHYCALHRPHNEGFGKPSIWYAESNDLLHWGNHKCILRPRDTYWEEIKIGGGAPSIKTSQGWLQIYHGKGRNQIYSLFALLLDLQNPYKIINQSREPILKPEKKYETEGFFGNVIFTNGIIEKNDGKLWIYYGACDETICLAKTTVDEILTRLEQENT